MMWYDMIYNTYEWAYESTVIVISIDITWYDISWHDMIWYDLWYIWMGIWKYCDSDISWHDMIWYDLWYICMGIWKYCDSDMTWHGMIWSRIPINISYLIWHCMTWDDLVRWFVCETLHHIISYYIILLLALWCDPMMSYFKSGGKDSSQVGKWEWTWRCREIAARQRSWRNKKRWSENWYVLTYESTVIVISVDIIWYGLTWNNS